MTFWDLGDLLTRLKKVLSLHFELGERLNSSDDSISKVLLPGSWSCNLI